MRIADYFDATAARFPDREALVYGDVRMTFGQARRYVHAVAHRLRREPGLSDNAIVGIYSGNDHRIPLLQLGVNRADLTWTGIHSRSSAATNAEVASYLDCEVLFFHSEYESQAGHLLTSVPSIRTAVCIDRGSEHGPDLETWLDGCWQDYSYTACDPGRMAYIQPTGGTTGPAKGAVHTHYSTEMQVLNVSRYLEFDEGCRLLSVAPLSHAAGSFSFGCIPNGCTHVIMHEFDADEVLRIIEAEQITHVFFPPTVISVLLVHPRLGKTDFSSLKCLLVGSAPIAPEKFRQAVRAFGPVLVEGYAQSETLLPVLLKKPPDYLLADGSFDETILRAAGKAIPPLRVDILSDDGLPLPAGEPGEIVVRGAPLMSGYYKLPEATQEVSRDGWHHTGDVGIMDQRGFVTIVDRKKDMIITGGFNVFPTEIETVIYEHPAVLDCIVIGVPDEKWGEAVKALVKLKPGNSVTDKELIGLCRDRLGGVKTPKSVEFWDDLPRNAVGKLLRREARAKFWEGQWRSI
jgi:acyl-CoA synthetase (AMP-forming)/AMP-acid ligase II